jgi:cell division protein FtsB
LAYDGERADAQVVDQLETILRHVADELATWRTRALKAEAELKESGARGSSAGAKPDPETRGRVIDLEQENKALRQRVDAARLRVHDLLSRLTFLEEQARETAGNGGGRAGAGSGTGPAANATGGGAGGGGGGGTVGGSAAR